MKYNSERILATHVGSLPRPRRLVEILETKETGGDIDLDNLQQQITAAITNIEKLQRNSGIDIVNDGENSKTSYSLYIRDRLSRIDPKPPEQSLPKTAQHRDLVEHPKLVAQRIIRWAETIDKERVIASTDCGFATFAGSNSPVIESIVWEKLNALTQGTKLASQQLWHA